VQATHTHEAKERIAFSLHESERVVSCVAIPPDIRHAA
jgi:hypothetical protein